MSNSEEALKYFATYAGLVTVKMMMLGPLTGFYRTRDSAYANEEDFVLTGLKDRRPVFNHPMIERIRRCSLNDLENIVPFFIIGGLFAVFSGSPLSTILWHYRIFVASRFLHSIAYLIPLPQPSRALCYFVGIGTNLSMAIRLLMNTWFL
ncbi:microsomal glutathione S-transferase 1 [Strongylocentrotus purpuratus]|uniref:Microsomal glutathione S-transferase 1 n=1 Tax=Strongylocentrotus purpuratus TaxID=7668 RepID=A0A7M7FZR1_STRPU|nr:microsomal glutathione S-transferase 1 [Strongylocentrotus purpuratus]|eukprot:XP_001178007.1 PREDICTED: microsomal glutathione S-transferase 1 [Strongylocentrotus purpuratus]